MLRFGCRASVDALNDCFGAPKALNSCGKTRLGRGRHQRMVNALHVWKMTNGK
jgi:hypothetical protein